MTIESRGWYILIAGWSPVNQPLSLAEGVTLRPLGKPLGVFDLAAAGSVGFREWAALEPIAFSCRNEIETLPGAAVAPGFDSLNRAWLALTLLGIRGCTKGLAVACSTYSWDIVAGANPGPDDLEAGAVRRDLERFEGNLLDYRLHTLQVNATHRDEPIESDAEWVFRNYSSASALAVNDKAFYFALRSCMDWRFASDPRSAIAILWSGIEALFDIRAELVFRLSITIASLLEVRGAQRVSRFREIKALYGLRSKAVHGADLKPAEIARGMDGSFKLLTGILYRIVERGEMFDSESQATALLC